METDAVRHPDERPIRWDLPVLGALAVLSFVLIPIGLTTIYSGLPAHPLFLHVPVIFIPLAAVGALAIVARPQWFRNRAGAWIGLAGVVALGSLNLTMSAGDKLRAALGLEGDGPGVAHLIAEHSDAAGTLRVFTIAFLAFYLITLAVHATVEGQSSGVAAGDRVFAAIRRVSIAPVALRLLTALLALGCLYYVFRTGDLGSKAVWLGRLQHAHHSAGGAGHQHLGKVLVDSVVAIGWRMREPVRAFSPRGASSGGFV